MDSLTQATLGAAVAHACWNHRLGRSSLLWGAALGTLPDLDVLAYPLMDNIQKLYWHRGESHSLLFAVIGSLLMGWLFWKTRWKDKLTSKQAATGIFLILITHYVIDLFNIYGTQLLAPFSRHGFGLGNMFIVDPLFTLPMLAGVIAAGIKKGRASARANWTGLIITCIYALFSLVAHTYADHTFKRQLAERNIEVRDSITGATAMNTLLWRHVARTPEGLLIGYFSIIGDSPGDKIQFDFIPHNEELVQPYRGQRNFEVIQWFSQGFWTVRETEEGLIISDVRMGELRLNPEDPHENWRYIFSWGITEDPDELIPLPKNFDGFGEALGRIWKRIFSGHQH